MLTEEDAKAREDTADHVVQAAADSCVVTSAGESVLVEFGRKTRVDPEGLADRMGEGRLRHAVRIHRTMLDVLATRRPADDAAFAEQLRLVARVTAALLDDRNSLAISFSSEPRLFVVDRLTRDALRAEDPVRGMIEGGEHPSVVPIEHDDPLMLAAIGEARRRWPEFARAFATAGKGAADPGSFSVKFAAREGEVVEHLWVSVTAIDGETVRGTVGNEPVQLKELELGKPVELPVAELEDWLFFRDRKLIVGFTVKVVTTRMEEAAAKARAERLAEAEREGAGGAPAGSGEPAGATETVPRRR